MRPSDQRYGGLVALAVQDIRALKEERDALRAAIGPWAHFPFDHWITVMNSAHGPPSTTIGAMTMDGGVHVLSLADWRRARRAMGLPPTSSRRPSRRSSRRKPRSG